MRTSGHYRTNTCENVVVTDGRPLRETFDQAAALYHQARPRYPAQLWDDLASRANIGPGANVLEIGPASGVATEQLARRGASVTAIELGAELAQQARHNLRAHNEANPNQVKVVHASFDTWEAPAPHSFDTVLAATAWHWLDPQTKYDRAHQHLRPGGKLAFWKAQHVVPEGGDTFFADIQSVYDHLDESMPADAYFLRPGELPVLTSEIEASGLFRVQEVAHYDWEITYDADAYIALLQTFSGHLAMGTAKSSYLYQQIRERLAARPSGTLRRHWGAVLHVAQAMGNN